MRKLTLAIVAAAAAALATPAAAQHYGHGHGHGHRAFHGHGFHGHSFHKPVHHGHHFHKPSYHVPHHTVYVKPHAHVVHKAPGCFELVKTYGGHFFRKPVECQPVVHKVPTDKVVTAEPAPAPAAAPVEEVPQK